jgi:hypothetical protein
LKIIAIHRWTAASGGMVAFLIPSPRKNKNMRLSRFAVYAALSFSAAAHAGAPNSGTVTTEPGTPPVTPSDLSAWTVSAGTATAVVSTVLPPDGSPAIEFDETSNGSVQVDAALATPLDVRSYDSFSFWAQASATHIGDYVFLIDTLGRRRWYHLVLQSVRGYQRPTYSIDAFVSQDTGFNLGAVKKIRYGQAGQASGGFLRFGPATFEHNVYNHGDASSSWYVDIGTGTLSTVADGANGTPTSLLAQIKANAVGQADIAVNLLAPQIMWDWSGKSFVSFYFKDSETALNHYFLVYDKSLHYRQWIFNNPTPNQWFRVNANLLDASYAQSGVIDLSSIVYFEVGVFGAPANASHTFQVDEVSAY